MTLDDLRKTVADCNRERRTIDLQGGNTLRAFGAPQPRADVTISTNGLSELLTHEYHDLTCSTRSGIRVADFAVQIAKHGQFVPIDVPQRRKATVGGALASGWLGPRRHFYARARDLVIGSQVLLADGTMASAGGMVVKNVSGYDMTKLYIGSFGTLGIITQLNFKTLPLPQRRRVLIAKLPEGTRDRAAAQVTSSPVTPAAAFCIEGFRKAIDGEDGIDGRIYILLEGSETLVDRATRDLRSALGRAGVPETTILDTGAGESFERILDASIESVGERSVTYRDLGMPGDALARGTALRDAANRHELFTDTLVDMMNGDVFLRVSERDSRAFAEKLEGCDDEIRALRPRSVIAAGDAPIRASLNSWGADPPAIEKMRALKAQFDPNRILNPGRFVGGI
ncbi:MAG TPA: FAD-binding oxidoreductase [Candidatus Baltobacteraceae bacterium]|nr:FAD-binding oxidoreductase [Candidatus Baltobacteraceae bacterium]